MSVFPVVRISRFFTGVVNDDAKYELTAHTDELGFRNSSKQHRYHKNQHVAGQWLLEYSEPGPDGMTMKHFRQLPPEIPSPTDRLANCIYGTKIQLDPSKYGISTTDKTASIVIDF